ncbi:MAG: hypothetical protein HY648_08060 [Acidobacteria bacterium]|nr:hypothetical protein [Acidobacteriota bacterium]
MKRGKNRPRNNWTMRRWQAALSIAGLGYLLSVYLAAALPGGPGIGKECLPEWLRDKAHDDYYVSWTRWIPRSATSWCLEHPPIQILGNQRQRAAAKDGTLGPKPIPLPGRWQVSVVQIKKGWPLFLPYIAWTSKGGTHFRLGARWDDVDHYYTFPSIALARPFEALPDPGPIRNSRRFRYNYLRVAVFQKPW